VNRILILRPQPGADQSARLARSFGLEPTVAPLFTVGPLAWEPVEAAGFDAVMMTSANAARHGEPGLAPLTLLPCYAVGEATAAAAREAGFGRVTAGDGDAENLIGLCARDGVSNLLHLCGREHRSVERPGLRVERRIVYASDAVSTLPPAAREALEGGAVALLHSPRAAALFRHLVEARGSIAIAAISGAAAEAAGDGWLAREAAPQPTDEALLELAAKLCKIAAQ
jgi:uroporphyrinogen-III synthase